jgi:hypothetical protein
LIDPFSTPGFGAGGDLAVYVLQTALATGRQDDINFSLRRFQK